MNRFRQKRDFFHFLKKVRLSFILFIALFFLFLKGIGSVSNTTKEKQLESLNDAINRSVIHCYCVEGTYPPSLSYLEEHYGLVYDKEAFFIDYVAYGSNIMPDVTIIEK